MRLITGHDLIVGFNSPLICEKQSNILPAWCGKGHLMLLSKLCQA